MGLTLIGKRPDSFKHFYAELKPILEAAIRALPTDEEIQQRVRAAVEAAIRKRTLTTPLPDWLWEVA